MDNGASSYRRFLDGDDKGLAEIVRNYSDGLILYLNGIVNNISVAEELMEESFFKIITKKPKFNAKYSFKTWLYTIGRNVAIDYLRRKAKLSDASLEDLANSVQDEYNLERLYIMEERKIPVHRALKKLNAEYRQILWLLYFEGLSNAEASVIMKKSSRQMKNLVYRAKSALKSELDKEGFVYEEL
ncbi:MAG: RNA polymerase sigma factor [Oscillospiraceae bacterium]|nr:RNA polymerase sigma factor [Oscillospiraceae bacterium]